MSSITLRFPAQSHSIRFVDGKVPCGAIMKWIDEAGYACAAHWAKGNCLTVTMGGVHFRRAITMSDMVEVDARLARTGNTSMNIAVEVRSGDLKTGQMNIITECLMVLVAVDSEGRPIPVDPWLPETPGDMAVAHRVKAQLDAARSLLHRD